VVTLGAAWIALSAYPALVLASSGTVSGSLIGQLVFAIGVGLYGGSSLTAMLELFPTAYRGRGHAISYQLGVAIFGGSTPFIATWLVGRFASPLAPGIYVAIVGAISFIAIQFVPETRGARLRTSIDASRPEPDDEGTVAHRLR
jgi:MHS family proline/betaine transporter-like MFS transporter